MPKLSQEAILAAKEINVHPNVVLKIDGYTQKFSSASIRRYIKIGDPGLVIGSDWKIGGYTLLENQSQYLMFNQGATTKFTQQAQPDRGQGSGVARMLVVLIDKDNEISRLVSPGQELADILARGCEVELGFDGVLYPDSYVPLIRGYFEGVQCGAGYVVFAINQIEDEKNRPFIQKQNTLLGADINDVSTSNIPLSDTSLFYTSVSGPAGVDTSLTFYARIGDEIIAYTGVTATHLTGITRGALGTTAAEHATDDEVYPIYRIQGLAMDIALKMMLSGWEGPFVSGVEVENFGQVTGAVAISNAIFFKDVDIEREYGIVPGTYFTTTGATNGGNNITDQVTEVVRTLDGSYLIAEGQTFTTELNSPAVISFRSQYDSWGPFGLGLSQKDVDIVQHELLRDRYLGSFDLDFIEESIDNVKNFLDLQVYKPAACFSAPSFGRASSVFHAPPLADEQLQVLDRTNIQDPDTIKIERSLSTNFANSIEFRYDYDVISGKYKSSYIKDSVQSQNRIKPNSKSNRKPMVIEARGMRTSIGAPTLAESSASRLLARYQFGAEYIKQLKVTYGGGYALNIGQIVMLDTDQLNITNFNTGDKSQKVSLVEVLNKSVDVPNAEVTLDLVNTAFGVGTRFATISPSSFVAPGSTTTKLNIKRSFGTKDYEVEGNKWLNYIGLKILVHDENFTVFEEAIIQSVYDGEDSSITLESALSFTPLEDYIIDLANYPNNTDANDQARSKLLHFFFSPNPLVATGVSTTQFTVAPGDVSKFKVGFPLIIHNEDYTTASPEVEITDVTGVTVTVGSSLGFTPTVGLICDLLGFPDSGECYRWT